MPKLRHIWPKLRHSRFSGLFKHDSFSVGLHNKTMTVSSMTWLPKYPFIHLGWVGKHSLKICSVPLGPIHWILYRWWDFELTTFMIYFSIVHAQQCANTSEIKPIIKGVNYEASLLAHIIKISSSQRVTGWWSFGKMCVSLLLDQGSKPYLMDRNVC